MEKNKLNIDIKILESNKQIEGQILQALMPQTTKFFDKVSVKLKKNLSRVVSRAIQNTPEYDSLLGGKLKYEFGIPDASSKLSSLINIWSTNIKIDYTPPTISRSRIRSSLSAEMIKIDFSDVLYSDYAEVYDFARGYSLPWLRWLLLEGRAILVKKYQVQLGSNPRSRTGFAIMTESTKSWRVPGEFSGTESNNWITRAIRQSSNDIMAAVEGSLK